jgi:membrane associated rhomboid family serine protease
MFPIGDENEPGHGPAIVTLAFIAINVIVFLVLQGAGSSSGDEFTYGFAAVPYEITHGTDLVTPTEITIDGQTGQIPQEPGPSPIWLTLLTSMFMHGGWLHIGGNLLFLWVFGAYIVLFPGNRVTVFLFRIVTQVPALVAIGLWAALQFVNGIGAFAVTEETGGGVAYMAHIGGFVAGVVAGLVLRALGGGRPRGGGRAAFG